MLCRVAAPAIELVAVEPSRILAAVAVRVLVTRAASISINPVGHRYTDKKYDASSPEHPSGKKAQVSKCGQSYWANEPGFGTQILTTSAGLIPPAP